MLKVTLERVKPAVWRRFEVPSTITLGQLHAVLGAAFGWEGDHLHQFDVRGSTFVPEELQPDGFPMWGPPPLDEDVAELAALLPRVGDLAGYVYDLGDGWQHRIQVEGVGAAQPDEVYPRCTGGAGLAPEEDTGVERVGSFGAPDIAEVNATLARLGAVTGKDLPVREPDPDQVFAGLYPDLAARAAGCTCGECADPDDDELDDDPSLGGPSLPVLNAPPDAELAATAAASPLVRRALALARWLGLGRPLTPAGVLRPADALEASAALGLDRPVLPGGPPSARSTATARPGRGRTLRSAKDLPALDAVWRAATAAGFVEVRGQKAFPGPELARWDASGDPAGQLEAWSTLLAGYLLARTDAVRHGRTLADAFAEPLLGTSVLMLYTSAPAPLWAGLLGLGGLLVNGDDDEPELLLDLPEVVSGWATVLEDWAVAGVVTASPEQDVDALEGAAEGAAELSQQLGAVLADVAEEPDGLQVAQAARQGPVVEVPPFGRYALARILRGHGLAVPDAGFLSDAAPDDLLLALAALEPSDAVEEVRRWLQARPDGWLRPLAEVMGTARGAGHEAAARRSALPAVIAVVAVLPEGDVLDEWQQDRWLAAAIAIGRHAAGRGPVPSLAQQLWRAVDTLSLGADDPDGFAELVEATDVAALLAAPGGLATAARLDHPQAAGVLRRVAGELDDPRLAGEVRRALGPSRSQRPARTKRR